MGVNEVRKTDRNGHSGENLLIFFVVEGVPVCVCVATQQPGIN